MRRKKIVYLVLLLLLAACLPAKAQKPVISPAWAKGALSDDKLLRQVQFLADPACEGRRTGTAGSARAAAWLAGRFREIGLQPCDSSYFQEFRLADGTTGQNVAGIIPGTAKGRYVIVAAHYDGLGILNGKLYPGADSNASGVVALLSLAEMLREMNDVDMFYGSSVLFVALDGKMLNMSGSQALWKRISEGSLTDPSTGRPITRDQLSLMVNLDQLGCSTAPLKSGDRSYLILLSEEGSAFRNTLSYCNGRYAGGLELGFDYYGSADFTRLFYRRICDQKVFLDHGVRSVMFTSSGSSEFAYEPPMSPLSTKLPTSVKGLVCTM